MKSLNLQTQLHIHCLSPTSTQVDISGAKKNSAVAGLLRSAMLPLQQVVDGEFTSLLRIQDTTDLDVYFETKFDQAVYLALETP